MRMVYLLRGYFALILVLWSFVLIPEARSQSADHIPWSGYWWPFRYGGLATGADYRGHPAPLEKYLMLTTGETSGDLTTWYRSRYYDSSAPAWYGLCANWAWASLLEKYEIVPSSEDNIVFRVGDKKGLLTLCHDDSTVVSGSGRRPNEFHAWLLNYIGAQKKGFSVDLDAGDEVWTYPIYGYDMTSTRFGDTQSVRVTIHYASDKVAPDFMGTSEKTDTYTYDLFLDGTGAITGGEWTGASINYHPDSMWFPMSQRTFCPYIDYTEVRRIAQSQDDFLEDPTGANGPVPVQPGTYHLVLLDADQYQVDTQPGDHVKITVTRESGGSQDVAVEILDVRGNPVFSEVLANEQEIYYDFDALTAGSYTVHLTQNDYSDPSIYSMAIDKSGLYDQFVPYIPKDGKWSAFNMINAQAEPAVVSLVTCGEDGAPIQTVYGPSTIQAGREELLLFDNLSWRPHEYGNTESLRLISDQPVHMINLFAHDGKPMAGFAEGNHIGSHLVLPDTYDGFGYPYMRGAIFNQSFTETAIDFQLFDAEGVLSAEFTETIPARGRLEISADEYPFYYCADGGWIDMVASDGGQLTAYQYVANKSGTIDSVETLFALPVHPSQRQVFVPHVTLPDWWWTTRLTLINPNDRVNPVTLHLKRAGNDRQQDMSLQLAPYEKRVIELQDSFGLIDGLASRSILEITGTYAVTGYYSYGYTAPNSKDEACLPLLTENDFSSRIILPQYVDPDGGHFWTGVHICNPNAFAVEIAINPFDASGALIEDMVDSLSLAAGANEIFTIHKKFADRMSEIGFIEFEETLAGAPIGGFYLYGNMNNRSLGVEMLAGAHMAIP